MSAPNPASIPSQAGAPVRFGLIGTGRIGQVHAGSIARLPDAVLTHVCDPFVDGARRVAAAHEGARVSADAAEVFADEGVDAVIVASPTATHVDLLAAALEAGKPVLCEKPIDLDLARVDALRERAAESPVPIALGFNRRFDPHFAEARGRVAAGEIGRLEHLQITSRDPAPAPAEYLRSSGGIFRDMTIHDFDTARFFVPDIVSVQASGGNVFSEEIAGIGDWDSVAVIMRGRGGEFVTITNSRHSAYGYDQRLEVFGSDGLIEVPNVGDTTVRLHTAAAVESRRPYQNFIFERYAEAYRLELDEFIRLVRGEESRSPGFEDGRAALVLALAAEESARTGRTVDVDL